MKLPVTWKLPCGATVDIHNYYRSGRSNKSPLTSSGQILSLNLSVANARFLARKLVRMFPVKRTRKARVAK